MNKNKNLENLCLAISTKYGNQMYLGSKIMEDGENHIIKMATEVILELQKENEQLKEKLKPYKMLRNFINPSELSENLCSLWKE